MEYNPGTLWGQKIFRTMNLEIDKQGLNDDEGGRSNPSSSAEIPKKL